MYTFRGIKERIMHYSNLVFTDPHAPTPPTPTKKKEKKEKETGGKLEGEMGGRKKEGHMQTEGHSIKSDIAVTF